MLITQPPAQYSLPFLNRSRRTRVANQSYRGGYLQYSLRASSFELILVADFVGMHMQTFPSFPYTRTGSGCGFNACRCCSSRRPITLIGMESVICECRHWILCVSMRPVTYAAHDSGGGGANLPSVAMQSTKSPWN